VPRPSASFEGWPLTRNLLIYGLVALAFVGAVVQFASGDLVVDGVATRGEFPKSS
jgi:hypothetical protein